MNVPPAAAATAGAGAAPAAPRFVPLRPSPGGERLWCFPGHDGVLLGLIRLGHLLDRRVDTVGLDLARLDPRADVEAHAATCADEMLRTAAAPYRLLGVCYGAVLAWATAARLEAAGARVTFLALVDGVNPAWAAEHPLAARVARLRQWRHKVPYHLARIARLGPRAAPGYLAERLRDARKYRTETSAFREAAEHYRPPPWPGDALLVRLRGRRLDAPALGWGERVQGRLTLVDLPLQPEGALARESGARVAATVDAALRAARGD